MSILDYPHGSWKVVSLGSLIWLEGAFSRVENDRAISYSGGEGKGIVFYPDKRELPINVDNNGNTRDAGQIQTHKINFT